MMTNERATSEFSLQWRVITGVSCTFAAFLLDYVTKSAAVHYLKPSHEAVTLIPYCLSLAYSENDGIAFGLMQGKSTLLLILTPFALLVLGVYLWKTFGRHPSRLSGIVMGLIVGGALGNIWSRWTDGYVVDFILVYFRDYHWPNFNIADSALCLGVGLALWILSRDSQEEANKSEAPSTEQSEV